MDVFRSVKDQQITATGQHVNMTCQPVRMHGNDKSEYPPEHIQQAGVTRTHLPVRVRIYMYHGR